MIIDELLKLADSQTVTGGSTVASTNYIDVGAVARKLGQGRQLWLVVNIISISGGDSSDTFQFGLEDDDNTSFTSAREVCISPSETGVANFAAGRQIIVPIPPSTAFQQYVRGKYAVTANAVPVVDSFITDQEPYEHTAYADGI